MKKLHIALSLILSLSLVFASCSLDTEDEAVSVSGDLAFYAEMDTDILKEKCEGNYIEVSGTVYIVYQNTGKIYLGNNLSDKIQFSCDLANADDTVNIEKGDLVTVRGKCSSCIGSTFYLQNCKVEKSTKQTESESTAPTSDAISTPTTEPATEPTQPVHTHHFSAATCTAPKTCSCGKTEGSAKGHSWQSATCTKAKTCSECGATSGSANGHNYSGGKCTKCGIADPNYNAITYILNTVSKKFHRPSCSRLPTDNREDTTLSREEIIELGYDPCGHCDP